jgi:hypothetical protein
MLLECGIERALNIRGRSPRRYIPQSLHGAQGMREVRAKVPQ